MFHALQSQDAQRAAIRGAAEKALSPEDFRLFQAVWKVTESSRTRRYEFAHHLWGLPTIPDALALLDPKDALREVVAFTKRMNEWVQQMNAVQRRDQMITYYPPNYALLHDDERGARRVSSKNSKANRIETGERSGGIRRNLFGGSRRKIAKKIAKNKRCYANTLLPPLNDAVERR
jgi:hypothetical protein